MDWNGISKEGYPALLNLWLVHTLDMLVELSEKAELPERADKYRDWADRLRTACELMLDQDGFLTDGLDPEGNNQPQGALHSQLLGALTQIKGFNAEQAIEQRLLPAINEGKFVGEEPSAYWWVYPLRFLVKEGHGKEVIAFIKDNWKAMAEFGSTWEGFAPRKGVWSYSMLGLPIHSFNE